MKIETVDLTNSKMTVLELSRNEALRLAQDLISQVNGNFNGAEFKIGYGHYFKVAVNRVQPHIQEAIEYLAGVLDKLPEDTRGWVINDLASGDETAIWNRYYQVKLN
mgnify:CR=1 FL=1